MAIIPEDFYLRNDVVLISRQLLGKELCTNVNGEIVSGIISETEAYAGITDRASHAYGDRFTRRTSVMYESGGRAYIYLCYGFHYLFNVVTNNSGIPDAVLIRAIIPRQGMATILKRRNKEKPDYDICNGPGKVTRALGITKVYNGISLLSKEIWIEDIGILVPETEIEINPRIGVAYAGPDALLPYRFTLKKDFALSLLKEF